MLQKIGMLKLICFTLLFALTLGQITAVKAQEVDSADAAAEEATAGGEAVDKTTTAPGESSNTDPNRDRLFLPITQTGPVNEANVQAAAVEAKWSTVLYDEMCSFPNGWSRYDYNGTGYSWVYNTVGGYCTAQPNGYGNVENTLMQRTFSLTGAKDARITFRFMMKSEINYDFLLTQYSCDSGATWNGTPHARSNPPAGWQLRTINLKGSPCLKKPTVILRFAFVTDASVVPAGALAPAIDYIWVEKYQ